MKREACWALNSGSSLGTNLDGQFRVLELWLLVLIPQIEKPQKGVFKKQSNIRLCSKDGLVLAEQKKKLNMRGLAGIGNYTVLYQRKQFGRKKEVCL